LSYINVDMWSGVDVFEVGGITINLFGISPSKPRISVAYIHLEDSFAINQMVHRLEHEYGCIAGPQYGSYRGLEPGVYFICNDYSKLSTNGIEYSLESIDSGSYVMKYLVLKAIARKIQVLGDSGKLFLPRKWLAYSQITCCDSVVLKYSEPYRLFALRPCLVLRVEHIPVDDKDRLFLLADSRFKRFHTLTLDNVVKILLRKGFDLDKINELLRKHYYSCIDGENKVYCMISKVYENNRAEVIIGDEVRILPTDNVLLNPHPKYTRDFIEKEIGEKLSDIEKIQRVLGGHRPKRKIEDIKALIKKLLIENNVFPLKLSDVEYNLELTPQRIIPLGEE